MQALYARAVADALHTGEGALPELYTEAMDAEQIWLQLDMQLGGALRRARRLMRKAGDVEQLINPDMEGALKGAMLYPEWLFTHSSSDGNRWCCKASHGEKLIDWGHSTRAEGQGSPSSSSIKATLKLIPQNPC